MNNLSRAYLSNRGEILNSKLTGASLRGDVAFFTGSSILFMPYNLMDEELWSKAIEYLKPTGIAFCQQEKKYGNP